MGPLALKFFAMDGGRLATSRSSWRLTAADGLTRTNRQRQHRRDQGSASSTPHSFPEGRHLSLPFFASGFATFRRPWEWMVCGAGGERLCGSWGRDTS